MPQNRTNAILRRTIRPAALPATGRIGPSKRNSLWVISSLEKFPASDQGYRPGRSVGLWPTVCSRSLRLPAQEGRNVELILIAGVMHRGLPSVLVEALRSGAPGVVGDRQFLA